MTTWLLTGNDTRDWDRGWWQNAISRTARGHKVKRSWSTGPATSPQIGDRFFMLRQGSVRGIVGTGWCTSDSFRDEHWADPRREANYVDIALDVALAGEDRLPVEVLKAHFPSQHWRPQSSGTKLHIDIEDQLEELWAEHLGRTAEEAVGSTYIEGAMQRAVVNRYERSPQARAACIAAHGTACVVCGFDFEKIYGPAGRGRVVVHHLIELSRIGKAYEVDPVEDLRPVCPNCHLMIHSRRTPYSIDELKALLPANRAS